MVRSTPATLRRIQIRVPEIPALEKQRLPIRLGQRIAEAIPEIQACLSCYSAVAAKLDAKKKDSSGARAVIQNALGLTGTEAATLKALAADWQTQMTVNKAATAAAFQAAQSQIAASGAPMGAQLQAAQAVRNQRWALDTAHIQQLQAAVGNARFAVIDAAVQSTSTVHAMTMPTFTTKP